MNTLTATPLLRNFDNYAEEVLDAVVRVEDKEHTATIYLENVSVDGTFSYLLSNGREYSMKKVVDESTGETIFSVTVNKEYYRGEDAEFVVVDTFEEKKYRMKVK